MRIKSTYTKVSYAGRVLLEPGMHMNEMEKLSLPRHYTVQAIDAIGAAAPALDAYGNASGSLELSTRTDYPGLAEAMAALVEATAHADAHQLGRLDIEVAAGAEESPVALHYNAGLTEFAPSVGKCPGGGFALTLDYNFILVAREDG